MDHRQEGARGRKRRKTNWAIRHFAVDCLPMHEVIPFPLSLPDTPFSQLPLLEFHGKRLGQSLAIARFLAGKADIYGADEMERAQIDAIVDYVSDYNNSEYFSPKSKEISKAVVTTANVAAAIEVGVAALTCSCRAAIAVAAAPVAGVGAVAAAPVASVVVVIAAVVVAAAPAADVILLLIFLL